MRAPAALLAVLLLAPLAAADGPATHTGRVRTEHVEVRYRPGSRAAAVAPCEAARAEQDVVSIYDALHVRPEGTIVLYLYDDVEALRALTRTTGNGGFTSGPTSHVPIGNDQTRRHELAHAVQSLLPRTGEEPRNRFFADGLANALLQYVHSVHVHAVAAFYEHRGELPPLAEMVEGDFYVWMKAHAGFNAYDVAASFLRYLWEKYGVERLVRYVTGTPVKRATGKSLASLEREWRAFLHAYALPPEVETLLRQRAGETVGFESWPEALWRERAGEETDWTPLADRALESDGVGTWTREGDAIRGVNPQGAWSACVLGKEVFGNCAFRATVRTPQSCPIQLRLGPLNQAMLVNGAFLYRNDQPVASSDRAVMSPARRETDFMLVRLDDTIEIWIDGERVLVTTAAGGPTAPGIGVHRGAALFENPRIRRLP